MKNSKAARRKLHKQCQASKNTILEDTGYIEELERPLLSGMEMESKSTIQWEQKQ
jgi:hypothetical protein